MAIGKFGMVALDIDGTLVNYDEEATPRVVAAVRAVAESGAHVVLATGKASFAAQTMLPVFGLDAGHCVATNGAVVFSYHPVTVRRTVTFDPRPIVESALRTAPRSLIAVEAIGLGYRVNARFPDGELGGELLVEPIETLVAEPVTRVLVRDPDAPLHAFREFAAQGVSKATALAALAVELGVAQESVLAIGDGSNDIEMLRWAGRGVAMGHAPEVVKTAADAVTGSLDEDGVATELCQWFEVS